LTNNCFCQLTLEGEGRHLLLVSEPVLGADEKAALAAVIDSGWLTMGDRVRESYVETNVLGTLNVLEAARQHGRHERFH
jgi:nucleoside-diphosphate-sugar epimerase